MDARVIITEAGDTVAVPYLVLADTSEEAVEMAKCKMRSIIESVANESKPDPECDEQAILDALQHGYWWADLGSEEFTVMIQEPEHIERLDKQAVTVYLQGGVVSDVTASGNVEVVVYDYDIDGVDENRLTRDSAGRQCVRTVWNCDGASGEEEPQSGARKARFRALKQFLEGGFVILTLNPANEQHSEFEAWAYSGPLDFHTATPVRFGLGPSPLDALQILQQELADMRQDAT